MTANTHADVLSFPRQATSFMRHAKGSVFLLQWEERDDELTQPVFYFLLVPDSKLRAFEQVAGKTGFVLGDYGRVIHWGYGEPDGKDMAKVQAGTF